MNHLSSERYSDVPTGFQMNYLDTQHQRGPRVPRPRNKPRGAPDLDILFDVQEDLYKANAEFRKLRQHITDPDTIRALNRVLNQVNNAARLTNRYLKMHGSEGMFEQEGTGQF